MEYTYEQYQASAAYLRQQIGTFCPDVAMVLGSGLGYMGDEVEQGQVIAKVGSTGYSTGPHLHFGIRSGGDYVNPLQHVSP